MCSKNFGRHDVDVGILLLLLLLLLLLGSESKNLVIAITLKCLQDPYSDRHKSVQN
jgi:hypothetical protein